MRVKILPYKMGSASAKDLARALNVLRIRPEGRFKPTSKHLILNWGNSRSSLNAINWLNKPLAIANASNKLKAFQIFKQHGVSIPDFTADKTVAQSWLSGKGKVVERHKLSGTNGEGIKVLKAGEALSSYCPLYVKYQRKDDEYRVHVFKGRIIDLTQKRKRNGIQTSNPYVRNLDNGWVYCRDNVNASENVKTEAIKAVQALGLDFGAVDVITREGKCWILEVNTSPGITGTTLQKYVEAVRNYAVQSRTSSYNIRY